MTAAFITSRVLRTKRSLLVSENGLPILYMVSANTFTFLRKDAYVAKYVEIITVLIF